LVVIGGVMLLVRPGGESSPVSPVGAQPTPTTAATPTTEAAPPTTEAAPPTTVAAAVSTGVKFHEVTMELLGDEGFATTCGVLIMRSGGYGSSADTLVADGTSGSSVPRLSLSVSEELSWQRDFPEPLSGEGFGVSPSNEECHGGTVEGSPVLWDGLLMLTLDDDVIEFLWHFDYYKTESIWENFTIRGEAPVEWTESPEGERTTEVSGEFSVTWYQNLNGELVHLYEPFEGSARPFHFKLTVTPTLDSIALEEPLELDEIGVAAVRGAEAWNAAAQQLGVENLTLENGTSWQDEGREGDESGVNTVWELSTETASARVTHRTFGRFGELFEIEFQMDSGYGTESGRSQLHDATRVMIRMMEPTLSNLELEDLASRLATPEEFAYEEVGQTVFMSGVESDRQRWVLATPMG
jgi:hypothetical protein